MPRGGACGGLPPLLFIIARLSREIVSKRLQKSFQIGNNKTDASAEKFPILEGRRAFVKYTKNTLSFQGGNH